MVMCLAIGLSFLLVMSCSEERLFAFGADEVLHVPLLPQCVDDPFLNWTPTRAADGDTHLIMASEAVELIMFLPGIGREFRFAVVAVEVVRMVGIAAEFQYRFVNHHIALLTQISSNSGFSFFVVTFSAKSAPSIPNKTFIGKRTSTRFTSEAVWMPGDIHSFDDSADDESLAFGTARGKENVEVRLAVFPTFELVENSIFERLKALCADKTHSMPSFFAAIHYFLILMETFATLRTDIVFVFA